MPASLSIDLRERFVAALAQGASCPDAAAHFGVSVTSANRWVGRVLLFDPGLVAWQQRLLAAVPDWAATTGEVDARIDGSVEATGIQP